MKFDEMDSYRSTAKNTELCLGYCGKSCFASFVFAPVTNYCKAELNKLSLSIYQNSRFIQNQHHPA
jgi:hypothetical protein